MQTIRLAILLIRDSTTGAGTELLLSEVANKGVPWKKMFVETSQNSQENTCAKVSFPINCIKKRLWHRCFLVNFAKFLRTPFFQNTSGRLRLCYARRTVGITDILELPWGMKRTSSMKRFFAKMRLSAAILLVLQVLIVLSEILVLLQ